MTKVSRMTLGLAAACLCCSLNALAQNTVTLSVNTLAPGTPVASNFVGLSFGPSALHSHVFNATNVQVLNLFSQMAPKYFRMGGTWVDTNSSAYVPSIADVDEFFGFIQASGIRDVAYTLKLENGDAEQDVATASHIWNNYRAWLTCFAIGNEPDLYKGGDPAITNVSSYLDKWNSFASTISNSIPLAVFGGPDCGGGGSSYGSGFINAEKDSGNVDWFFSHYYVGGSSSGLTAQQMIDAMLSGSWLTNKYPTYYNSFGSLALAAGLSYRITEFNSYSGGDVAGGSDGFASALFGLDSLYWWAGRGCSGVSVHTGLSNRNGVIYEDANGNWQPFAWAYALKAFDLGCHGSLKPVSIGNPSGLNITAYATGGATNLWISIINKEHGNQARPATVIIGTTGIANGTVTAMSLVAPDVTATNGITLGGAAITNNGPWLGRWTMLGTYTNGQWTVTIPAASAVILQVHITPSIGLQVIGGQTVITYTGNLLSSTNATGPFNPVPNASSPWPITPSSPRLFYRSSNP